jgi:hypothetical protein
MRSIFSGHIDMRAQAEVYSAMRTATLKYRKSGTSVEVTAAD